MVGRGEKKKDEGKDFFLVVVCIKLGPRTCYVGALLLNYNPSPGTAFKRILGTRKCRASRNEEKGMDLSNIFGGRSDRVR